MHHRAAACKSPPRPAGSRRAARRSYWPFGASGGSWLFGASSIGQGVRKVILGLLMLRTARYRLMNCRITSASLFLVGHEALQLGQVRNNRVSSLLMSRTSCELHSGHSRERLLRSLRSKTRCCSIAPFYCPEGRAARPVAQASANGSSMFSGAHGCHSPAGQACRIVVPSSRVVQLSNARGNRSRPSCAPR